MGHIHEGKVLAMLLQSPLMKSFYNRKVAFSYSSDFPQSDPETETYQEVGYTGDDHGRPT